MKNITILGSTGSMGTQALDVVRAYPDKFRVAGLCADVNAELLLAQAKEFSPEYIGICSVEGARLISRALPHANVESGPDAASAVTAMADAEVVLNGVRGFAGMKPLLTALKYNRDVALANKESVICAHTLLSNALAKSRGRILPIDSEQSAIFQCIGAGVPGEIKRLILTGSGGPFRGKKRDELKNVTADQAVKHPRWRMGKKISIDSSTLFNKGLEIMEASYLFGVDGDRIDVLIHPEAVVHSLVEFKDGANIAQLSSPDMRLAIQYALTYPKRVEGHFGALDLASCGRLTFEKPDTEVFRAIPLAYRALAHSGAMPIVYNAANEAAVDMFVHGEIGFLDIADRVEYAMDKTTAGNIETVSDIIDTDSEARALARRR